MTPQEGDWVAAQVLTPQLIKSCGGIDLMRVCPCQYGPCGYCGQLGQHDKCTHRNGATTPSADGWLTSRAGYALAPFHTSGRSCQWVCPCCGVADRPPGRPEHVLVAPVHSRPVVVIERPTLF